MEPDVESAADGGNDAPDDDIAGLPLEPGAKSDDDDESPWDGDMTVQGEASSSASDEDGPQVKPLKACVPKHMADVMPRPIEVKLDHELVGREKHVLF